MDFWYICGRRWAPHPSTPPSLSPLSRFILVVTYVCTSPLLLVNNILWYRYTFCISTINWWQLGYFHFLTIKNAAMNMYVWVFVWAYFKIFLVYIPRSGISGSHVNSISFWGTANCFPKCLHHFICPSTIYESSNFPTSLSTFIITRIFYFSHSCRWEVLFHCVFSFPWRLVMLSIFPCTYCLFVYFLWNIVYSDLFSILIICHYIF